MYIPKGREYAVTLEYRVLRVCERLGGCMTPMQLMSLPPRELAKLLAYEDVRRAEERPSE